MVMLLRWMTPSVDEVALNINGSSYGNPGKAGYGGLIRDHEGKWLIGFSGHIDFADILEVELLAILNGLLIAWNIGVRKVSCRSNCMKALSLILDPRYESGDNKYAEIIYEIKELVSRVDWSISFCHEYREANQCAKFMAKLGANAMVHHHIGIFSEAPKDLLSIFSNDAMGVLYRRS